jgi:hypothetical protein
MRQALETLPPGSPAPLRGPAPIPARTIGATAVENRGQAGPLLQTVHDALGHIPPVDVALGHAVFGNQQQDLPEHAIRAK